MFEADKSYKISEVCKIVNESGLLGRQLYPALMYAWIYNDIVKGRHQQGSMWLCRGKDLNKYLLSHLNINDTKAVSSRVHEEE